MTLLIRNSFHLHQLGIAGSNDSAVYLCDDTFTADFLHIRHSALINGFAVSLLTPQNLEKCDGEMGPGDGPSCLGKGKKK